MLIFTKIVKIFIKKVKERGIWLSLKWWKWTKDNLERLDKKSPKKIDQIAILKIGQLVSF